jgi:hypothetical protein
MGSAGSVSGAFVDMDNFKACGAPGLSQCQSTNAAKTVNTYSYRHLILKFHKFSIVPSIYCTNMSVLSGQCSSQYYMIEIDLRTG